MKGKIKKVKNGNNEYVFPITVGEAVYVESDKTLNEKLNEIEMGGSASINDGTTSTTSTWSSSKINQLNQSATGKPHTGKTIALLGDSIMTVVDTAIVSARTGMAVNKDYARGGSSIALRSNVNMKEEWDPWALSTRSKVGEVNSIPIENFDYAMIFIGTNDWGHQHPLGTIDETDELTILGAYNVALQNFISRKPDIKMMIATPIFRKDAYTKTTTLKQVEDGIKSLGDKFGIPVLKMLENGIINDYNKSTFLNVDLLHPNQSGIQMISHKFAAFINANF